MKNNKVTKRAWPGEFLRAPHKVNQHFWWYEEKRGICVCTEAFTHEGVRHVELNYIPWNSIRAALKRRDKK